MKKLDLYTFDQALQLAIEKAHTIQQTEMVMLDSAMGRVLASDVVCVKNLPSFDNSAMDGFAFRHSEAGEKLAIHSTIFAGDTPLADLAKNSCYKIMTGAQIPSDADTIVPIENCSNITEDCVYIPSIIKKGNAFRVKGEEQAKGNILIKRGIKLNFSHIAMLSAQGIVAIEATRELRIAVLSTGDEIKEPWQEANEDEIYNANAFGITALLKQYGFSSNYIGSIPDDLEKSKDQIASLCSYDVIITTGGISMGDADFLEEAFVANGLQKIFHGVNVKPGRPTMMGIMGNTFVMAMPGNPLTTLLNVLLLSIPILKKLQGQSNPYHQNTIATISQSLTLNPNRTNLVLGYLDNGIFHVTRDNKVDSGMLTPLMQSNAVAIFAQDTSQVNEWDSISVVCW